MAEKIGPFHGISAFVKWLRGQPGVEQRGPDFDPADQSTWPMPDRIELTLNLLRQSQREHEDRITKLEQNPKPPPAVDFWSRPGLFLAWGLYAGGVTFPGSEPQTIARKAADAGFKWVALQWDDPKNHPQALALRDAVTQAGLDFVVWEAFPTPGSGANAVRAWGAKAYIAQAEQPEPWADIVGAFDAKVPASVVTTFWGIGATASGVYDKAIAAPVVSAGWDCLTEAYANESAPWTPDNLNFVGVNHLGWNHTHPVIGLWDGKLGRLSAQHYIDQLNLRGYKGYSVWLAETMTQADWNALAAFNQGR